MTPVPRIGDVFAGRDAAGRVLRISAHPGSGRVVLSIWQDGACLATLRLSAEDAAQVAGVLGALGATVAHDEPFSRAG